jgi:DNA-binding transcriptional ArsR family regulator
VGTKENRARFDRHTEVFRVLSNPLRHQLMHLLAEGPRTVTDLALECESSKSNVSQHLARLEAAGLVESGREGRRVLFSLSYPELAEACRLIDRILADRARRDLDLSLGLSETYPELPAEGE